MAMTTGLPEDEDGPGNLAEINTTPLIDVMLVLLIMLIITIPVQTHAVKIDLPSGPPPVSTTPPPVVTVVVAADGSIRWNDEALPDHAALEAHLAELTKVATPMELHLQPDAQAPYAQVAEVLAAAQRHGVTKLGIVGSNEPTR
jgi:biopolymer transport protein ExbD